MKKFLLIILAVVALASCRTVKPTTVVVTETRDSIRTEVVRDSVKIYERDSIFVQVKADTVYIERFKTLLRDRITADTIRQDVIKEVPVVTEVEVPQRYIPSWVWWSVGANALVGLGFVARMVWKLKGV